MFFSRPWLSLVPRLVAHQSNTKSLLHSAHWMTVRHMHLLYTSYFFLFWWCYVIWYILISNCDWFILKIWKTKGKWKLFREGKKMVKEDIATIDLSLDTSDASRWVFFVISLNLQSQFFSSCKGNRKTKYWTIYVLVDAICVSYIISQLGRQNW